ncbi:hypothetical protein OEIGOIKO_03514 [Streptomyces chrestomyceticus JCM 4735]|uniref:Uncharacterized protein n=1 Tax=Streptomyces chrestomyceticus JCM 4735 TaxID=1306181 RepID=A0A7U9PWX4_9ACTN|nr:hypothetical protein [Streptomyces chrestomyceticus]GCD35767.1 hypothetical protein OEIGOIKO_03514 [Streptomyces chrestomyceticus JCM 4735]
MALLTVLTGLLLLSGRRGPGRLLRPPVRVVGLLGMLLRGLLPAVRRGSVCLVLVRLLLPVALLRRLRLAVRAAVTAVRLRGRCPVRVAGPP